MAVVGMTIKQLPSFALLSATDYQNEMAKLHDRYDPLLGTSAVDVLDRLQVFRIFSSTWFSLGLIVLICSIVVCTLDRIPRLWRQVRDIRVVQPDAYFDPRLPDRATVDSLAADGVRQALHRHRFRVREAEVAGTRYLYGDRNQYTKLATLFTHTGLILFLIAAGVTWKLGSESGLVVANGEALTVQPIGTPNLLLVKNLGFSAPGLATGQASDFTTDLAVYQNGREIARKTVRVNDPLSVAGYTFHQNGFGPAPVVLIRDNDGRTLWSGAVPMTDQAAGFPYGQLTVPGTDVALQLLLQRQADGTGIVLFLPYRVIGTKSDGTPLYQDGSPLALGIGATGGGGDLGFTIELQSVSQYTLLIAKNDPGQGLVWLAFASLISGIVISFYLPRRRIWARLSSSGQLAIVGRSDRYVDFNREFSALLEDLVRARSIRHGVATADGTTGPASATDPASA
jgi:cytochrome c biogenesis protein